MRADGYMASFVIHDINKLNGPHPLQIIKNKYKIYPIIKINPSMRERIYFLPIKVSANKRKTEPSVAKISN